MAVAGGRERKEPKCVSYLVEQKWGVHTDKGAPITYQVTEQWESLSTATEVVEKSLEKDGLTWRTRKLAADLVEIDVQDADDTLIGLWDADALDTACRICAKLDDLRVYCIQGCNEVRGAIRDGAANFGLAATNCAKLVYMTGFGKEYPVVKAVDVIEGASRRPSQIDMETRIATGKGRLIIKQI